MVQVWKGFPVSSACLFEVANTFKHWAVKFIKIFCRLSRIILLVPWSCALRTAREGKRGCSTSPGVTLVTICGLAPLSEHWANCQVVAGDVVLQSLVPLGQAAAAASSASPKPQPGGERPWTYSTHIKRLLKPLFGCARGAVAQAFPLKGIVPSWAPLKVAEGFWCLCTSPRQQPAALGAEMFCKLPPQGHGKLAVLAGSQVNWETGVD